MNVTKFGIKQPVFQFYCGALTALAKQNQPESQRGGGIRPYQDLLV